MAIGIAPASGAVGALTDAVKNQTSEGGGASDFSSTLVKALEKYDQIENGNNQATLNLLSGNTGNLSDTMVATEKATIALNLTVAVRNKAVDAYKEIMNMQI